MSSNGGSASRAGRARLRPLKLAHVERTDGTRACGPGSRSFAVVEPTSVRGSARCPEGCSSHVKEAPKSLPDDLARRGLVCLCPGFHGQLERGVKPDRDDF